MGNHEAALRKYIESLQEEKLKYTPDRIKDWIFGAINFAYMSDLIDYETQRKLMKEYDI